MLTHFNVDESQFDLQLALDTVHACFCVDESQLDLQLAVVTVHAWNLRWRHSFTSNSHLSSYQLPNTFFGLEFVGDDSAVLQQFNLSLRRWCHYLPHRPALLLSPQFTKELGVGDALRLALGRVFSLFGRQCAMDNLVDVNLFFLCTPYVTRTRKTQNKNPQTLF